MEDLEIKIGKGMDSEGDRYSFGSSRAFTAPDGLILMLFGIYLILDQVKDKEQKDRLIKNIYKDVSAIQKGKFVNKSN